MNEFGNVVVVKLKMGVCKEVFDVFEAPSNEVVHANDMKTIVDKALAKVRTQKAGRAGN
jgi:hypothetical protein